MYVQYQTWEHGVGCIASTGECGRFETVLFEPAIYKGGTWESLTKEVRTKISGQSVIMTKILPPPRHRENLTIRYRDAINQIDMIKKAGWKEIYRYLGNHCAGFNGGWGSSELNPTKNGYYMVMFILELHPEHREKFDKEFEAEVAELVKKV